MALTGKVPASYFREVFDKHDFDHNGTLVRCGPRVFPPAVFVNTCCSCRWQDLQEFTQLCRTLDRVSLNKSVGGSGRSVIDMAWEGKESSAMLRPALIGAAALAVVAVFVYRRSRP